MSLNPWGRSQFNITTAITIDINCHLILAVVAQKGQKKTVSTYYCKRLYAGWKGFRFFSEKNIEYETIPIFKTWLKTTT